MSIEFVVTPQSHVNQWRDLLLPLKSDAALTVTTKSDARAEEAQ